MLGANGAGKSHFLRLLAGDDTVEHHGSFRLGAGVVPGLFHQTHEHPEWRGKTLLTILHDHDVVRGPAMSMLRRYEMHGCAEQPFETLSGGQQARFQILLLERSGATMLLLDEPTDNLDLVSAEALEAGLAEFTGTVSPSPTTAGSCAASTASSCSAPTARSPTTCRSRRLGTAAGSARSCASTRLARVRRTALPAIRS